MHALILLRLAVLGLGERATSPWWSSQFVSPSGLSFLERITPRAAMKSAFWTGTACARRTHDAAIGLGAVAHLFRLPFALEEEVEAAWEGVNEEEARRLLTSEEAAKDHLTSVAGTLKVAPQQGPVRIGEPELFITPRGRALLAAHYVAAFEAGTRILPYASQRS